jgi:hypothetical protein
VLVRLAEFAVDNHALVRGIDTDQDPRFATGVAPGVVSHAPPGGVWGA